MPAGTIDVLVRFVGDSSKLQSEVAKVEGSGSKIKTFAKGVGAAIGAAFAVDQVRKFVDAGAELQDQMAASEQIFGSAAKTVQGFAGDAADAFGMSQTQALNAANTVAAFGKSAGLAGDDLAGFSTDLVGLAGDLASFRGTSPEEAIEAIGAALRGESEPIRKYGVLLDDATLRARAMKMGITSTTKEALTPQQKVLASQAELFAQTSDAQGDFAKTSDSAANQQKKLTADTENLQAALGTALLPVVEAFLPMLQSMAEFFAQNSSVMVPLVAVLGGLAIAFKLASVASMLFGTSLAISLGWLLLIVAAIAAVIAVGVLIVKNWDTIKKAASAVWQFMQRVWDGILNLIKGVWNWIKTNWPLLLAILIGPVALAVLAIQRNWDRIKAGISAVWNWIRSTWSQLTHILTAPFEIAGRAIKAAIDKISGWVGDIIEAAGRIAGSIKGGINSVIRGWNNLSFTLPEVDTHIPGVGKIGGWTIDTPNIPELDTGGFIMQTGLAVVHKGETVIPAGGGGTVINLNVSVGAGVDPAQTGRTIVDYIRKYERANGADWRRN